MLRVSRAKPHVGFTPLNHREPRRSVALDGFGILPGGQTFSLSVVDLSYDGCRIETNLALMAGTKFQISVTGLGRAAEAVVRWAKAGTAGLEFYPEDQVEASPIPRAFNRPTLKAKLSLRRQGRQSYPASLFDLTPKGCRVEFIETPRVGETMWAKLDVFDSIEASVRWVEGFFGGLEFSRQFHPAVFELLLARLGSDEPDPSGAKAQKR